VTEDVFTYTPQSVSLPPIVISTLPKPEKLHASKCFLRLLHRTIGTFDTV